MIFRDYDPDRDRQAALRIWREVGWLKDGEKKELGAATLIDSSHALVAEINGEAECLVNTLASTIRYMDQDLSFCAVAGVATSRVARKRGLASRLTARAVAADAAAGALVAGLGVFEQGFYNQIGFGNGGYEHFFAFDPARLRIKTKPRVPCRIGEEDWESVHASRLARLRGHGALNLLRPEFTRAEMLFTDGGFGLGYRDGPQGELTHHFWSGARGEVGPYAVLWLVFQTAAQFQELMALIRTLGDQVRLMWLREPQGIQLQDLVAQPIKQSQASRGSDFESRMNAIANWQIRICDLPGCLARTHLRGDEVRFNLALSDPIASFLDEDAPWRGVAGEYVVRLGPVSAAERGTDDALPTLQASVGAFTRLWLGVRPASGLATTDELSAPPPLLEALDWALRLPEPRPDWDY